MHPAQEELFEVLAGELQFRVGKNTIVAKPGDRVLVPAGTAHKFENIGDETAHFVCEVSPALGFEQLIETMFSLAEDGKVSKKGMPNPLRLAVIARHHFDDVRLPFPPAWLQRLGLAFGAPLGRLLGYKPTYEPPPRRRPPRSASSSTGVEKSSRSASGPTATCGRAEGIRAKLRSRPFVPHPHRPNVNQRKRGK